MSPGFAKPNNLRRRIDSFLGVRDLNPKAYASLALERANGLKRHARFAQVHGDSAVICVNI
jgi:hypothetical protein